MKAMGMVQSILFELLYDEVNSFLLISGADPINTSLQLGFSVSNVTDKKSS